MFFHTLLYLQYAYCNVEVCKAPDLTLGPRLDTALGLDDTYNTRDWAGYR
jgi:hypothetical protein